MVIAGRLAWKTEEIAEAIMHSPDAVSYTHLRAHETVLDLVCRLLLENKKEQENIEGRIRWRKRERATRHRSESSGSTRMVTTGTTHTVC